MKILKLTTEGDCEGRSTRTVGYFKGSINQIITYCIQKNIRPYYDFGTREVEVIDVTDIKELVSVTSDQYGRLKYKTPEELEKQAKIVKALDKLSDEEKTLLGVRV